MVHTCRVSCATPRSNPARKSCRRSLGLREGVHSRVRSSSAPPPVTRLSAPADVQSWLEGTYHLLWGIEWWGINRGSKRVKQLGPFYPCGGEREPWTDRTRSGDAPCSVVQPQHGRAADAKVALGRGNRFFGRVAIEQGVVDAGEAL